MKLPIGSIMNHAALEIYCSQKGKGPSSGLVRRDGCTLVPLRLYFNPRGIVKLEVGVARGKRQVDKRQDKKKRDWQREKSRLLREKG